MQQLEARVNAHSEKLYKHEGKISGLSATLKLVIALQLAQFGALLGILAKVFSNG